VGEKWVFDDCSYLCKDRAGVEVLWRDNNSSSKGVANRVTYQDFKTSGNNPICDVECRDVGMLDGLQGYISTHKNQDILIVLHMMGSQPQHLHDSKYLETFA
jgi:glucan phosphoethanolaminetransferase (alkaline phosphatase superfamily)